MNSQTTMPTEGQFVAVWEYNGEVWSDAFKWFDNDLFMYHAQFAGDDDVDDFCEKLTKPYVFENRTTIFYTK